MTLTAITRNHRPCHRTGQTLIELVLAMAVMSIVITALGSAMVIASRSLDLGTAAVCDSAALRSVADQINADAMYALDFSERTAHAITFTVADRTGDGNPETIRYAWSGNPGDPLTRRFNGGAAINLIQDVHKFDLSYLLTSLSELAEDSNAPAPEGPSGVEGQSAGGSVLNGSTR